MSEQSFPLHPSEHRYKNILDQLRAAFDSDDTSRKNIALRKAHDEIERLHQEDKTWRELCNKIDTENDGLRAEIERLRSEMKRI